jgi:cytidylate kinase
LIPVIAIDGPSGSGKGTVSRRVAAALGWHLLDSGSLYRLVALAGTRAGLDPADEAAHAAAAAALDIRFGVDERGAERVLLDGHDVSDEIRSEGSGAAASRVAAWPAVRAALMVRQRGFMQPPGLVADGRDMGSIVFPDAGLKVFLTASPEERALRRHKQLKEKGLGVNLAALSAEIAARDRRDATRKVAPLVACVDSVVLDTTSMDIESVVNRVLALACERWPGPQQTD